MIHSDCVWYQDMFKLSNKTPQKQTLLITGGTGTLGKELLRIATKLFDKVICYSRDEYKQAQVCQLYPEGGESGIRYFVGDVRDTERLLQAMQGVTHVIHAAAMKRIDTCEYNPQEAIKTNIIGSQNVCECAIKAGVKKCILVSTDKAPSAITLYGSTKFVAERCFIDSNNLGKTRFSVVRYGNVIGSRGSVFELWQKQKENNIPITVTSKDMTRFFWKIEDAAKFVLDMLEITEGGEIFLPMMPSYKIIDIAKTYSSNVVEVGLRGSEKLHEVLMTEDESKDCYSNDNFYIIYPQIHDWIKNINKKGFKVVEGFTVSSERNNQKWITN